MAVITVTRYNPPNIISCQITADPTQSSDVMTIISTAGEQAGYTSIITCTPVITDAGPPYGLVWTVQLTKAGMQTQTGVEFDWIVFDQFAETATVYTNYVYETIFVPSGETRSTATPSMISTGVLRTVVIAIPHSVGIIGVGAMVCEAGKVP